jgi:hypothetical protein
MHKVAPDFACAQSGYAAHAAPGDKTLNLVAALRQSPAGPLSAGFEQRNALNQNVFQ